MNKNIYYYIPFFTLSFFFISCKKEFDIPPIKLANDGAKITIAQIKMKYNPNNIYKFKGDTNLSATVIADEVSGNLYKEIYIRDRTAALHVKLVAAGGLFIGDSIRINLNGVILNSSSGLIQLDSVDAGKNIVKLASGLNPVPDMTSISQLIANTAANNTMQSRLIQLNDVEFIREHRNQPYANTTTKATVQYTLQDCSKNQVIVRTSGYCYFANQTTPGGNGSIIAIASQFNTTVQLILRAQNEVNMSGALCAIVTPTVGASITYLAKNFEDGNLNSGDWVNVNAVGTISWTVKTSTSTSNPTKIAECNNFIGSGNQPACETWLISPSIDLSHAVAPTFSFTSASLFTGPQLQTFVSTNYSSGSPTTATWTAVYPTYGTSANHVASGNINLSAYKTAAVRIAFKYTGNNGAGQRWQVDNIWVGE